MTKIAFIGLGIMGGPMAANLVKAGFEVVGFNRSPAAVATLVAAGGSGADTLFEALTGAEIVVTMLPDGPDVESVLLGPDGAFAHVPAGTVFIDFSTIQPAASTALATEAARLHLAILDAPVSGGEQGAIAGTLSVMVGGEAEVFAQVRPILDTVGTTVVHVGASGAGQIVKAANQLIVAGNLQLVAEALAFIEAHGVDTGKAVQVLSGGLAGSTVLDRKAEAMLSRNFAPGFRVALHHKDLGIVLNAAREAKIVIPLGALVAQLMAALEAQGDGGVDHTALFKQVNQLSGRP
jgi:2-hydroxy-3-oxopropionate reductase